MNTQRSTAVSSKQTTQRHFVSTLFSVALLSFSMASHAVELPNFSSVYDVEAMGLTLGQAKQSFTCQKTNCILKSDAKPSGFAAAFFKDSSHETIQLIQTTNQLTWQSYHKLGISYKNNQPKEKHLNLSRNLEKNSVVYREKNRQWPLKANLFDSVSIVYAIQHAVINQQSIESFTLQDSNFQDELLLQSTDMNDSIYVEFEEDELNATKYIFSSEHVEIELWLLPKYNFFPGKIRIINKEEKTITLTLSEPPNLL